MIYMICGSLMIGIGIIFFIFPAKKMRPYYGYYSYLARLTPQGYEMAQRWSRKLYLLMGVIQLLVGLLIHYVLFWDNLFYLWLFTFYLFFIPVFDLTEKKLHVYLASIDALPVGYMTPDEQLTQNRIEKKNKRNHSEL